MRTPAVGLRGVLGKTAETKGFSFQGGVLLAISTDVDVGVVDSAIK